VPQRGERIVPLIPRGFSLAETLISMAISAILLMGAARFLPALQRQALRQTQQQSLDNELWQRVYTVAKHLQRAGYCAGQCEGQPLLIASGGAVRSSVGIVIATARGMPCRKRCLMRQDFV
jgi:prepilin-type N-terminal cleavage/methylation domain-containing protein